MKHLKLLMAGMGAMLLAGILPAQACTCPPAESAEAQAAAYDFVGLVRAGEVYELETDEQREAAEAERAFEKSYTAALSVYIKAREAGEAVEPFEDYIGAFYAQSGYRPPPPLSGLLLTQMRVLRVLKGETSPALFVRSADPGMPACGVRYRPDTEILLLAKGADGLYSTWLCDQAQFPLETFEAVLGGE